MKKYLLPSALILVGFLGFALAQNVTKSIQLSQSPNGPIGMDSSNNVYFPAHVLSVGPTPSVATAGGTAATISGTDFQGTITGGGISSTTVIMTFARAFVAAPNCVVTSHNPATSPLAYNTVPTALNITTSMGAALASYVCSGAS